MLNSIVRALWYTLFIAIGVILIVIWLAHSGYLLIEGTGDVFVALGRFAGIALGYAVLLELLLVARVPALERAFGFDRMNRFHRGAGIAILYTIVAHLIFLVGGYAIRNDANIVNQFVEFFESWEDVSSAVWGAGLMLLAGVLSIKAVKKYLTYDLWYAVHLLMYIGAILAFGHTIQSGDFASGASLIFWLLLTGEVALVFVGYRIALPFVYDLMHKFKVERVVQESPSTYSVYIGGKHMKKFHFEAGQFAQFTFLRRGIMRHRPFSFSAPYDGKHIRITVKDFDGAVTSKIRTLVPGTRVIVDGPLGRFTLASAETEKYCLIGGGVGVTPIASLARDAKAKGKDAVVLISHRNPSDAPLLEEMRTTGVRTEVFFAEGQGGQKLSGELIEKICPDIHERDVYICGPAPMMDALTEGLVVRGISRNRIHTERFST